MRSAVGLSCARTVTIPENEDDLNKRRHFCYDARVPRDFVELDLNDFHELIAITAFGEARI